MQRYACIIYAESRKISTKSQNKSPKMFRGKGNEKAPAPIMALGLLLYREGELLHEDATAADDVEALREHRVHGGYRGHRDAATCDVVHVISHVLIF